VKPNTTLSKQDYINMILSEEIDLFMQSLSLLLKLPSKLIIYEAKLDGITVKYRPPPQSLPFGLYNLAAKWHQVPHVYTLSVHNDTWPFLEHMVKELRQKPITDRKQLVLPLHWFAKASNEMTSFDRLIAFWISFNALYLDPKLRNEKEAIKKCIKNNVDRKIAQRYVEKNEPLLKKLSTFSIQLRPKSKIAQELANLLNSNARNYISIFETTTLTIYGIRNNLFHGEYNLSSRNDFDQIDLAENLLSQLVRELIGKKILGYELPPINFVVTEETGI
jgi:hypothetical protein